MTKLLDSKIHEWRRHQVQLTLGNLFGHRLLLLMLSKYQPSHDSPHYDHVGLFSRRLLHLAALRLSHHRDYKYCKSDLE